MDQHSSQEDRPSFATFWQKNKSESADNRLTFVQSDPGQLEKQGKYPKNIFSISHGCWSTSSLYSSRRARV